jgi:hypothetical protein
MIIPNRDETAEKGAGDHKETVWVERAIGILMEKPRPPDADPWRGRRVVEYETKLKAIDPGFQFHDRDISRRPGLLRKKAHIVALGNKKSIRKTGQSSVSWPHISVLGGRSSLMMGSLCRADAQVP